MTVVLAAIVIWGSARLVTDHLLGRPVSALVWTLACLFFAAAALYGRHMGDVLFYLVVAAVNAGIAHASARLEAREKAVAS